MTLEVLKDRRDHIVKKRRDIRDLPACEKESLAGAVSQRACVYSGARVVLNPITDAIHLVHGPIGCASYTWDIRGSKSREAQTYRHSFSTDLQEKDIIFGGAEKLYQALKELVARYRPPVVFVYATCIVGLIGDDLKAVCGRVTEETGCTIIPVQSEGFKGNKIEGHKAACDALFDYLIGTAIKDNNYPYVVNLMGEYNVAGDFWAIEPYFKGMGVKVGATFTGNAKVNDLRSAHSAKLNLVQCTGTVTYLAQKMEQKYGIPWRKVSFFGLEGMEEALLTTATFFKNRLMLDRAKEIIRQEKKKVFGPIIFYKKRLQGKTAAIYMGGAAKALALIKTFKLLGMETVLVGTQSGKRDDYVQLMAEATEGTVIIDDANPAELVEMLTALKAGVLVGGVKERYLSYKLAIPFVDFNHDRTSLFAGFDGLVNFARLVDATVNSPVWALVGGKNELRNG
ncbi:MAG: nitrogenase iron-molybdenum cofactor biosynthesis protein NifE [Peptococcaceae bacterium]